MAAAALSAAAGPLRRADVSANPCWLLHLDCDAVRETYIGKYILFQLDKPEVHSNMVAFQSIFSFDIRTQLHGITVYSESPTPDDCVAILYADCDPDRLIALVMGTKAARTVANNQHLIYSWSDDKPDSLQDSGPRNYAVIQSGRVIKSRSQKSLSAALAVLDGTAPNYSSCKALPELAATDGATILQATVRNLDFLGSEPNAAVFKMLKRASLQATEANEKLNAVLTAEAGDVYTAKQMSCIGQGLIALLSLQNDNPRGAKLADGISVKYERTTLTATASVESKDLIAAFKAYTAKNGKANTATK
jgi:hypothetical protein